MLDKLDSYTVSFYDEKNFLYAVESSKSECETMYEDNARDRNPKA